MFLLFTGSPSFVAITDEDQYFISILDIANKQFRRQFRGFPKVKDEDGDWTEHEVEAINITNDEQCLVYTNLFTSEVIFTDFSGTKLRSIPGICFYISIYFIVTLLGLILRLL